jgi:hypothetical protein
MRTAVIGLVMLCAVGALAGHPREIAENPAALIAAAQRDAQDALDFARSAFVVAPDLRQRIAACQADSASAACAAP